MRLNSLYTMAILKLIQNAWINVVGSGLRLSIDHEIMEQLGVKISV